MLLKRPSWHSSMDNLLLLKPHIGSIFLQVEVRILARFVKNMEQTEDDQISMKKVALDFDMNNADSWIDLTNEAMERTEDFKNSEKKVVLDVDLNKYPKEYAEEVYEKKELQEILRVMLRIYYPNLFN